MKVLVPGQLQVPQRAASNATASLCSSLCSSLCFSVCSSLTADLPASGTIGLHGVAQKRSLHQLHSRGSKVHARRPVADRARAARGARKERRVHVE